LRTSRETLDIREREWVESAKIFLSIFDSSDRLLETCLISEMCHNYLNGGELAEMVPANRFSEIDALMEQVGFSMLFSGFYDYRCRWSG
jgi:hypothetical protein